MEETLKKIRDALVAATGLPKLFVSVSLPGELLEAAGPGPEVRWSGRKGLVSWILLKCEELKFLLYNIYIYICFYEFLYLRILEDGFLIFC